VTPRVEVLAPSAADDEALVGDVVRVINRAYADGEEGLSLEGGARITPAEVAEAIRRSEILAARVDGRSSAVPPCVCSTSRRLT
jgi:hypothetical protein